VLPLMLATGPGAEMRESLGTAVFSGMLGVTFFGLFLTPVFFVTLRKFFPYRIATRPTYSEAVATDNKI
jgi:HAE1 family hydrophobic/amphiphilic exporter-1